MRGRCNGALPRLVGVVPRLAIVMLATLLFAGCDKCGNRVKFNAPSLPDSCGANADPAR